MKRAIIALLVVAIAACGGSDDEADFEGALSYPTIDELAEALGSVGFGCEDVEPENTAGVNNGAAATAGCTVDEDARAELVVFASDEDRQTWIDYGELVYCAAGADTYDYALGPDWAVTVERALAENIASRLSGAYRHVEC